MIKAVFGLVLYIHSVRCQIESFAVGAEDSSISDFPHSASINAYSCMNRANQYARWKCGSSILNSRLLLTAAHCVYGCSNEKSSILIHYGGATDKTAQKMLAATVLSHKDYSELQLYADIALVKLSAPLKFSKVVRRVAIFPMRNIPYDEMATIAGWGLIDEIQNIGSDRLRHVRQQIIQRTKCERLIGKISIGVICGSGVKSNSYASLGDSGSALVVRGYIQVGLLSYKKPHISRSIVVYTDLGYYYSWILENADLLYCNHVG